MHISELWWHVFRPHRHGLLSRFSHQAKIDQLKVLLPIARLVAQVLLGVLIFHGGQMVDVISKIPKRPSKLASIHQPLDQRRASAVTATTATYMGKHGVV